MDYMARALVRQTVRKADVSVFVCRRRHSHATLGILRFSRHVCHNSPAIVFDNVLSL
jgi:hypothetical protein